MKTILITGGAGYIGCHLADMLHNIKVPFVILDDFSSSDQASLHRDWPYVEGDIADSELVAKTCKTYDVGYCIHMAAKTLVSESMDQPGLYRKVNVEGTKGLVAGLKKAGVEYLSFSSTCAVFGDPEYLPIDETHPKNPISPYGQTKLECEQLLLESGLYVAILRYFNVAGGRLGEHHFPETHLIPNVALAVSAGQAVEIYGTDYPTVDGTASRDYVHVSDIASANIYALSWIEKHKKSNDWNLGSGFDHTVKEIVELFGEHTGNKTVSIVSMPRRRGDPPSLVGNSMKAAVDLDWEASFNMDLIIRDALAKVPGG